MPKFNIAPALLPQVHKAISLLFIAVHGGEARVNLEDREWEHIIAARAQVSRFDASVPNWCCHGEGSSEQ